MYPFLSSGYQPTAFNMFTGISKYGASSYGGGFGGGYGGGYSQGPSLIDLIFKALVLASFSKNSYNQPQYPKQGYKPAYPPPPMYKKPAYKPMPKPYYPPPQPKYEPECYECESHDYQPQYPQPKPHYPKPQPHYQPPVYDDYDYGYGGGYEGGQGYGHQPIYAKPYDSKMGKFDGQVWGDPHFVGLDKANTKYDFQGQAGKTYNLAESNDLRLNSTFYKYKQDGMTVNGDSYFSIAGEKGPQNFHYDPKSGKLTVNGKDVKEGETLSFNTRSSKGGAPITASVKYTSKDKIEVRSAELGFEIERKKSGDVDGGHYVDYKFGHTDLGPLGGDGLSNTGILAITGNEGYKSLKTDGKNVSTFNIDLGDGKGARDVNVADFTVEGDPFGGAAGQSLQRFGQRINPQGQKIVNAGVTGNSTG